MTAERAAVARITVLGTCIGSYVVRSDNWVEIIGDEAGGSVLQSGANPALVALDPGRLQVYN